MCEYCSVFIFKGIIDNKNPLEEEVIIYVILNCIYESDCSK